MHTYQIDGLSSGLYTIRVSSETYAYSGKIISLQKGTAIPSITSKRFSDGSKNESQLKSANTTIQMQYTTGDRLKFTGNSGNYSTVFTDIPTGNKSITFNFIACTDGDNNNYPVVKIGTQTWMAENLKSTKYNDGNVVPNVTDGTAWSTLSTPAYCWYNNDAATYKDTYGALYNWYTVITGKLCPTGWKAPSDVDWTTLTNYLGGESLAGDKLREIGTAHWSDPNTGATNETGFTARPAGYRGVSGAFGSFGACDFLWSATLNNSNVWYRYLGNNISSVNRGDDSKTVGFSVRCLMGSSKTDPVITWSNPADIVYGTLLSATQLNATADVPGTFVYTPAIGTQLNAGANQDLKVDFTPTDAVNYNATSKTVKITVTPGTVADIDGNIYHTVTIGTQTWMVENLKTTKYNDGTDIPNVTNSTWPDLTTPAYCWYLNDAATYKATYGALYNWYAVNTGKLCPAGWHVPTDAEWTTLTNYLGGENVAGGKLKETGTSHWQDPNVGATNIVGFTALPGGSRWDYSTFNAITYSCYFWSAAFYNASWAWYREIDAGYPNLYSNYHDKYKGMSVRCIKD
jgi:uncharacterized protein (TIGR02145 family)